MVATALGEKLSLSPLVKIIWTKLHFILIWCATLENANLCLGREIQFELIRFQKQMMGPKGWHISMSSKFLPVDDG